LPIITWPYGQNKLDAELTSFILDSMSEPELNKRRLKIFFRFSVNKRFLAFEKIYD
jgi:hypothetical protein